MLKLTTLKIAQLNELLRINGATMIGTKANKVARLQEILGTDEIDSTELEDNVSEDVGALQLQIDGLKNVMANLTAAISAMNTRHQINNEAAGESNQNEIQLTSSNAIQGTSGGAHAPIQSTMKIQDMVGILPDFDPIKGTTTSHQFISKIEQLQQNYKWPEVMVLVAIQHKLKGMAKLWLDAQPVYSSWSEFVTAFFMDFPTEINAAETHKTLSKRKRKATEDFIEYYYAMLSIGRQGSLDDLSIITHVISGLNDNSVSKTLAAMRFTTCSDLLVALKNLKSMMFSTVPATISTTTQQLTKCETKVDVKASSKIKCYNCNEYGHIAAKCTQPQRKQRCTLCSKTGHIAKDCNNKTTVMEINDENQHHDIPVTKEIIIESEQFQAFIDTGSVCSLIRKTAAMNMQTLTTNKRFIGFGGCEVQASEKVEVQTILDNIQRFVTLYVVEDNLLPYDVLLGRDILRDYGYRMVIDESVFPIIENNDEFNISDQLCADDKGKVLELLLKFKSCFAEDICDIGRSKNTQMMIEVKSDEPIVGKRYQVPFSQRQTLTEILRKLLDCGIIRPSNSPHAASVLLVKKSNGENRMCIDFRTLNQFTIKKNYIMPVVEEQLSRLAGNRYYTTLDMTSGYYQIPIAEESKKYTAFLTHEGLYEHNVMPFGLVNAPMVFQEVIVNVIKTMKYRDKVINYVDEVIIASKTVDEGVDILCDFLEAIEREGLTLRPTKSTFMAEEVQFLGHVINGDGIRPGENKTKVIEQFPVPTTTTAVRQFLGITGYFRKFVSNYGIIARPLTNLLRKDVVFVWQDSQRDAFELLKSAIITKPVLTMYDATKLHEVHTDASSIGLSGVLMQYEGYQWKPVFYFSRQCNDAERNYASYELEVLAIVETLQRYRMYLMGQRFKVITDCNAVASTKATTPLLPRIARWWLKLQEFDFECVHRAATKNALADGLSRSPTLPSTDPTTVAENVYALVNVSDDWVATMQRQDENIKHIVEIMNGKHDTGEKQIIHDYVMQGHRLYRQIGNYKRLVVPQNIRWRVLRACHDEAGHFGVDKTLERLAKDFWFARMRRYVKSYIEACPECCFNKVKGGKREAQMHVREVVPVPFRVLHIDHLGPFVRSKHGNLYILVIVCAFTKYVVLKALRNTKTTPVLTTLRDYMTVYGRPQCIVTDRGTAFTSRDFQKFMAEYDVQHVKTAVRTPRANGQAERINKTVLASLKCSITAEKEWDEALPRLQWCINSQSNATTKESPNSLVFNYSLKDLTANRLIQAVQDDNRDDGNFDDFRNQVVGERIQLEQRKWKQRFDSQHRTPKLYKEGDLVLINNVPSPTGTSHKLEPPYKGPYVVTKVLPHDRYLVEGLPDIKHTRKRYSGVFTNDNMKPWCSIGPIDSTLDHMEHGESDDDSEIDGDKTEQSSRRSDSSGTAELSR